MTTPKQVIRTYLSLTLFSTLASSLIFGINTLFLLDAGLSIAQAFAANAFFTVGQVLFEIPTGVIADLRGRRISYLLGTITLFITTLLYFFLWQYGGPFWAWAAVSAFLGLGFTFFSGAVEAWLVDALHFTGHKGPLESVFAKGQIIAGVSMLTGSVIGGIIAQTTSLGVPYIIRAVLLLLTFAVASVTMFDLGFSPDRKTKPIKQVKSIFKASIDHGLKNRPVRWIMLAGPFGMGVGMFVFYALQPYLLELYGDPTAYSVAGLAAAIVAGAQVGGGFLVPVIRKLFKKRTSIMLLGAGLSSLSLFGFGFVSNFWVALVVIVVWAITFAAMMPIQMAYLNALIPSKQRATVLSFNSLMSSTGGTINQPALGKVADVYSYSTAYIVSGAISLAALPFFYLARKENTKADKIS
jgi:MFS family permease